MKVLVAPDSFKGSLSSTEAAAAMANGILRALPSAEVDQAPLADGGEGTVDALVAATGGRFVEADVSDPLGRPVRSRYGVLGDGSTAVIEMAAASGLPLLSRGERDPLRTTTYGTGELILDAAHRGAHKVVIGIGGSATVDGGTGMARALGWRFLDEAGNELSGGGEILERIRHIDASGRATETVGLGVTVACDVTNPLTGPQGAARIYAPQKGARPQEVERLEAGLANLSAVIRRDLGVDVEALPGAGAAGGLGAGLVAFLDARLASGIDIVLEAAQIKKRLKGAHVVFTGEGRVDAQSAFGKTAAGVAAAAARSGLPVVLLAGSVGEGASTLYDLGVSAIFSISRGPSDEGRMRAGAARLVEETAFNVMRTFLAGIAM